MFGVGECNKIMGSGIVRQFALYVPAIGQADGTGFIFSGTICGIVQLAIQLFKQFCWQQFLQIIDWNIRAVVVLTTNYTNFTNFNYLLNLIESNFTTYSGFCR